MTGPSSSRDRRNEGAGLSEETIIDAADRIVRHQGVGSLTIKRLCKELDVTPPSIYWHVENKSALVEALVVRIVDRLEIPPLGSMDGWDRVRAYFYDLYCVIGEYPGMATVMAGLPPQKSGFDSVVSMATGLQAEGVDEQDALRVIYTTLIHVSGHLVYREALLDLTRANRPLRRLRELTVDLAASVPEDAKYREIRQYSETYPERAVALFGWGLDRLLAGMRAETCTSTPDAAHIALLHENLSESVRRR